MIKKAAALCMAMGLSLASVLALSSCQVETTKKEDEYGSLSGVYTRAENCNFPYEELTFTEDGLCDDGYSKIPYVYNLTKDCVELCVADYFNYSLWIDVDIQTKTFENYDLTDYTPIDTYVYTPEEEIAYEPFTVSLYSDGRALIVGEEESYVSSYILNKKALSFWGQFNDNMCLISNNRIYAIGAQDGGDWHSMFQNENTLEFDFTDNHYDSDYSCTFFFYDNGFISDGERYIFMDISFGGNSKLRQFWAGDILCFDYEQMTCQYYIPQGDPVTEYIFDGVDLCLYQDGVLYQEEGPCAFLDYRIVETCGNKYMGVGYVWCKVGEGNTLTRI